MKNIRSAASSTENDIAGLGEELGSFSRRYYDYLTERLRDNGVNPGRRRIMRLLRDNGPMKMSQLAAEMQLDPKRLTKMVDLLEEAGYVRRVAEPLDRRARNVELTAAGDAAWEAINESFAEAVRDLFANENDEDLAELAILVRDLTQRLGVLSSNISD